MPAKKSRNESTLTYTLGVYCVKLNLQCTYTATAAWCNILIISVSTLIQLPSCKKKSL